MPADGHAYSSAVLLRRADALLSHAEDGLNLIAALSIFFLMFVGVAQIVGRTVFDFAIYGYIDWMEQASSLFAFLGIAYAQRLGSHIGMDLTMGWRPSILWLRLSLQICGYLRMIAHPDAVPVAVPRLITLETQVQDEIAEVLGREEPR